MAGKEERIRGYIVFYMMDIHVIGIKFACMNNLTSEDGI
jgi:hypothetical protein